MAHVLARRSRPTYERPGEVPVPTRRPTTTVPTLRHTPMLRRTTIQPTADRGR